MVDESLSPIDDVLPADGDAGTLDGVDVEPAVDDTLAADATAEAPPR